MQKTVSRQPWQRLAGHHQLRENRCRTRLLPLSVCLPSRWHCGIAGTDGFHRDNGCKGKKVELYGGGTGHQDLRRQGMNDKISSYRCS